MDPNEDPSGHESFIWDLERKAVMEGLGNPTNNTSNNTTNQPTDHGTVRLYVDGRVYIPASVRKELGVFGQIVTMRVYTVSGAVLLIPIKEEK